MSLAQLRRYVHIDDAPLPRAEVASLIQAQGRFRDLKVSGPAGPFHWQPGVTSFRNTPQITGTISTATGVAGSPLVLNLAATIIAAGLGNVNVDAWRISIAAVVGDTTGFMGGVPFSATLTHPGATGKVRYTITANIFGAPLIFHMFAAEKRGLATQIVQFLTTDGTKLTINSPTGLVATFEPVSLEEHRTLLEILPFLRALREPPAQILGELEFDDIMSSYDALGPPLLEQLTVKVAKYME
jgi:hypothetical protein